MTDNPIWTLDAEEVYATPDTSPQGLSDSGAKIRLKQYGATYCLNHHDAFY